MTDAFAKVEELEAALGRARKDVQAAESDTRRVERLCDEARPVRPHANSLLAYFWAPKQLPPVPPVPPERDIAAIRTERGASDAPAGPAYRDDGEGARARILAIQTELDAAHTQLARARQRLHRAEDELARRRARAELDDRFSFKEYVQLLTFLAIIVAAAFLLYAVMHGDRRF